MQHKKFYGLTISLFLLGNLSFISNAFSGGGIATDDTLGLPDRVISAPNSKTDVTIKQNDGITVGNNLFHSFSKFNIESGQTVTFTENNVNSLDNVISRVTGGSRSDINGILKSTYGGHADFYLINPSGVVFGKSASVNVPGSIHISTADELKLKNGQTFSAVNPKPVSSLSNAPPAAFGFLGTSKVNNGLLTVDGAKLVVRENNSIDLVAGNIKIENSALIKAPAGAVRMVAMQGQGKLDINKSLTLPDNNPSAINSGNISVNASFAAADEGEPDGGINVSGDGGGKVNLWGNTILFKGSSLFADNNGATHAGADKGIEITSHDLEVEDSLITSDALSDGNSGKISISSDIISLINGGEIHTQTAEGKGNAGPIEVTANTITLDGKNNPDYSAGFTSNAIKNSSGNAGDITVVAGNLHVKDKGLISSITESKGNAGNIRVTADKIVIDGQKIRTGLFSQSEKGSTGQAGDISVNARIVKLLNNFSFISTSTFSNGNAGNITIQNAELIRLDGVKPFKEGQTFRPLIGSKTLGSGSAGNVNINVKALELLNGGNISTSTESAGKAGVIDITANKLVLQNSGLISSASLKDNSSGQTGDIKLVGSLLKLQNSGITTSAEGKNGNGGNIDITADALVMETGIIRANTVAKNGSGGTITLNLQALIPSGNMLIVGGNNPIEWKPGIFGLNLIQAAAPNGLSGRIEASAPQLNLSGILANLGSPKFEHEAIGQDYCKIGSASSLTREGKGGLLPKGRDNFVY